MLNFDLPKATMSADVKSPMRLNSANAEIECLVESFVDAKSTRTRNDVTESYDQALLRLSFPSLESDNNYYNFTLRFPNKTIQSISQEIYLYSLTKNPPRANSNVAKVILAMHEEGVILYPTIEAFCNTFKLSGSVSKLYSILRENKTEFVLADLATSVVSSKLQVQTYYQDKLKDYTVCTLDYKVPSSKGFDLTKDNQTPRSKRGGSLW